MARAVLARPQRHPDHHRPPRRPDPCQPNRDRRARRHVQHVEGVGGGRRDAAVQGRAPDDVRQAEGRHPALLRGGGGGPAGAPRDKGAPRRERQLRSGDGGAGQLHGVRFRGEVQGEADTAPVLRAVRVRAFGPRERGASRRVSARGVRAGPQNAAAEDGGGVVVPGRALPLRMVHVF